MKVRRVTYSQFVLLLSLAMLFCIGFAACGTTAKAQQVPASSESSATQVVKKYLKLFNAGMISGDFSAMSSVYQSDATLTQSSPKGVTTVVHGLDNIETFYKGVRAKFPGFQWTVENMRNLATNVVLVYQHAGSPPLKSPGRCIHVFVIDDGKISTYEWATYYPGVP